MAFGWAPRFCLVFSRFFSVGFGAHPKTIVFFEGGHYGYSANEADYIYLICGEKKGYPRALCLQEEVRYSFPNVGFIFVDDEEDGEETMESICLSWPEKNCSIHFFETPDCIVLQRSIVFADTPGVSETLFLCNCRCRNGKAGLALQDEMERVISYYSEQGNTVNRADFVQNILRLYGQYRLTRPPDFEVSLCMECVHTRALKVACETHAVIDVPECPVLEKTAAKLLADQTFPFDVKKAMNIAVEAVVANQMDEEGKEEEDDAATDFLSSLMVPRICLCTNGCYHAVDELRKATVFASESPILRFGSFIRVSARMVTTCTRCERDSCKW